MGMSSSAELFYGFCMREEGILPWQNPDDDFTDDEDVDERFWRVLKERGVEEPKLEDFEDRHEYRKAITTLQDQYNYCELGFFGHVNGEVRWYVAVPGSLVSCGYTPEKLDPDHLKTTLAWDARLDGFCELMGIPKPGRGAYGWWLGSSFG